MSVDPRVGAVGGVTPAQAPSHASKAARTPPAGGFDRLLTQKLQGSEKPEPLRWSAHARDRLAQRRIAITPEVQERLEGAVAKAAAKGSRESLVLVDQMAFVVSVTNRTVITAVDRAGMRDQVFSNIDSAVLS